ncbi:aldehyde reductase [Strigomonas culicis]|nr:aldehyde reductase [Strigomonas culicis]|eukprot:EPY34604.1 aldehyde reductase [Strigomonas culicis]
MGDTAARRADELAALRAGIAAGMTLLDTAELYGDGRSETLVGEAIKGMDREKLFLVSKVLPQNASRAHIFDSCESSLRRLGTDYLDLYLLHWRGSARLSETVTCMEELVQQGKIRRWGVSNFDTRDMEALWKVPGGSRCSANQVLYHVGSRGIEYSLLPWMQEHHIPTMAYCPIAQAGDLDKSLYRNDTLQRIAQAHHATISQILLAFAILRGDVIAIPKSGKQQHVLENAKAGDIELTQEQIDQINSAFPPPTDKQYLDTV